VRGPQRRASFCRSTPSRHLASSIGKGCVGLEVPSKVCSRRVRWGVASRSRTSGREIRLYPCNLPRRGDVIQPGQGRSYVVHYRDAIVLGGCPTSSTFNATQTGQVLWSQ
jgi:hypothetical protein